MKNINFSFVTLCAILALNILAFVWKNTIPYDAFFWVITINVVLGIVITIISKEVKIKK